MRCCATYLCEGCAGDIDAEARPPLLQLADKDGVCGGENEVLQSDRTRTHLRHQHLVVSSAFAGWGVEWRAVRSSNHLNVHVGQ
eukprot:scaffold600_cov385-Prasinococcus_capsulatus_cf.AAC.12